MNSKSSRSEHLDNPRFFEAVRNSAEQIWQAGLGAFAKAQKEGEEMFSRLVQEGAEVQRHAQNLAEDKVSGLTGAVRNMAENIGVQASGSWEKLENVFEERVSHALHALGVPNRSDIKALTTQVSELRKSVDALAAKRSHEKAAAKKPAAKAAKKPAATKAAKAGSAKVAPRVSARRGTAAASSRMSH
ncbi:phasin family protein [Noviherbaspirillum sp.]|jgi:poly(hydroxyalkanoate) granule-associated protein|uniref:phasin family protein n=1 Tax=Noviherbaspirillum sp. TaxID=1926288 RepID=UPI0025D4ECFA|nr:phasin family protein [Noviherbaspirillum sp.]